MDSPKNMMATGNFAWVEVTTKIRLQLVTDVGDGGMLLTL